MAKIIDFWSLLQRTQEYISKNYAAALIENDKSQQLKNYIDKYLRAHDYKVEGMETKAVVITMMILSMLSLERPASFIAWTMEVLQRETMGSTSSSSFARVRVFIRCLGPVASEVM
mgnify:CR=1 FL=1